ncbi:MAG: hypothetical protein J7L61_02985 [Thermoplasmata archaeon]|nr:hypothetical protein [Thermoplasmata archaeon]
MSEDGGISSIQVPERWKSPVSYGALRMARLIREAMEELEWEFERESGEKLYDKTMVIVPTMKAAHVFRYIVKKPVEVTIETYDTRPTHSSYMPYLEIAGLDRKAAREVRKMLKIVVGDLERPPWEFTLSQRINHGLLMPEFREARRAWEMFGFNTSK